MLIFSTIENACYICPLLQKYWCSILISYAGLTSIMTQFKGLEPYHWPGWFIAALAIVLAVIVLLTFSEPRTLKHIKGCVYTKLWRGLQLSINLRSEWKIRLIVSFKDKCTRIFHI